MTASIPLQVLIAPDLHPYWRDALRRSGLRPVELEDAGETAFALGGSVLALLDDSHLASPALRRRVQTLHDSGAPAIGCGAAIADLQRRRAPRARHVLGVVGLDELTGCSSPVRIDCPVVLPSTEASAVAFGRALPSGTAAVVRRRSTPGAWSMELPLPSADDALTAGAARLPFDIDGQKFAHEFVSRCDHGGLRRLVLHALREAFASLGLPLLRLGTAPGDHAGVFAYRIDADDFDPHATARLIDELDAARWRATWFIDVERHEQKGGAAWIRRLLDRGHEVESHAYRHYTYARQDRNAANIRRSLEALRSWGADPRAFAAPFGSWNPGLHATIEAEGLNYSSEFSRLWGDLPAQLPPPRGSSVLWQMPVHPVCPALLTDVGADAAVIRDYFVRVANTALDRDEPAVLYGHPLRDLDRCPGLLAAVDRSLDAAEQRLGGKIARCTLGELHAFYRARAEQHFQASLHTADGLIEVCASSSGPAAVVLERKGAPPRRILETTARLPVVSPAQGAATRASVTCETGMWEVAMTDRNLLIPQCPPPLGWDAKGRRRQSVQGSRIRLARLLREARR